VLFTRYCTMWLLAFRSDEDCPGRGLRQKARRPSWRNDRAVKEIHPSELMIVFHHWIEPVRCPIEHNGDYYHE
jgi:hypothetical protein